MIESEDGNGTSCRTISRIFLVDLGVDGKVNIKMDHKEIGYNSVG